MGEQKLLARRIDDLCRQSEMSYYRLSYRAAVPITTLRHILDGSTRNPGIFTIMKLCDGFGISMIDFLNVQELHGVECEVD